MHDTLSSTEEQDQEGVCRTVRCALLFVHLITLNVVIGVFLLQLEVIGGPDKYLSVCRTCYKKSPLKVNPSPRPKKELMSGIEGTKATRKLFGTEVDQNIMDTGC